MVHYADDSWDRMIRAFHFGRGRRCIIPRMSESLTIIYERGAEAGWVATIPEIPGAFSQGKTRSEARKNVLDAMRELMEARRELALTQPQVDAERIEVQLSDS